MTVKPESVSIPSGDSPGRDLYSPWVVQVWEEHELVLELLPSHGQKDRSFLLQGLQIRRQIRGLQDEQELPPLLVSQMSL